MGHGVNSNNSTCVAAGRFNKGPCAGVPSIKLLDPLFFADDKPSLCGMTGGKLPGVPTPVYFQSEQFASPAMSDYVDSQERETRKNLRNPGCKSHDLIINNKFAGGEIIFAGRFMV